MKKSKLFEVNQIKMSDHVKKKIFEGFAQHALESNGIDGLSEESVSFEIFDGTEFVGAIVVQPFWEQLHIKYLYVEKSYRNQGVARQLMNHALEFGKSRGHSFAFVETMSFQAPVFYQKMGFTIEFSRAGYAKNTTFHYLKKFLNGAAVSRKITRTGVYGVAENEGKILLVKQECGPYAGKFDFPGGGMEFGETAEGALRREFAEEVAMEFDALHLIDNLTATADVDSFYQIGMIYQVKGCRPINEDKGGDLQHVWADLMALSEGECSKLLWKWRVMQK